MLSVLWLPAWGQDQTKTNPNHLIVDGKTIMPGCTAPLTRDGDELDQILRKCPEWSVTKRILALRAEEDKKPHFIPPFHDSVAFTSEQRPELCKQIDALPPDHKLTWEEARERGNCVGLESNGKRLYPTQENILGAIAAAKGNQAAKEDWIKAHPPKVINTESLHFDKHGNYLDKAEEAKAIEHWQKLHSSGWCAAAAQRIVKDFDRLTTACGRGARTAECRQFINDKFIVGMCSVSPAEPHHGYKQRANMKDPVPYAVTMAQEKPQPDSAVTLTNH